MTTPPTFTTNLRRLGKRGLRQIAWGFVFLLVEVAVFFAAAGRLDLPRAWYFFGLAFAYSVAAVIVIVRLAPDLIRVRGEKHEGTIWWDKLIVPLLIIMIFAVLAVAGLDTGRFHWSSVGVFAAVAGTVLFIGGAMFTQWAMVSNPYFEPTVRIQKERGHKVITGGPYRFVRHPGYAGMIAANVGVPLILGSLAALIPTAIIILLAIIRTILEDALLRRELPGYAEYAERVRYRLCPWVW